MLLAAVASVVAQVAPSPDPATLARYDRNKDGKLDAAELAAMQAEQARGAQTPVAAAGTTAAAREEAVQLSPFEVKADNRGYYGVNTMSGTRLNTKLEDLASSITVVTKEQMADFAMLDLNDIFNYEASTEGTGNYSEIFMDGNGQTRDNVQNVPQSANRIRGISAANLSIGNFAQTDVANTSYTSSGTMPVDPIDIEAVEISRGPNSNIFGLGEGSGTVNLVPTTANLTRAISTAAFRFDDLGGWRTSLDVSRPVFQGRLALRASGVYQHDAFRRKPSGFDTKRFSFMLRAQPFKHTSLRGSVQTYRGTGTRANSTTPRDATSYWRSIGSPTWDPVTNTVTVNGVATVMGANNPPGLAPSSQQLPVRFVDQSGLALWMIGRMPAANATNGPNNVAGTQRLMETLPDIVRGTYPLFNAPPGVSDRALYDWTSINMSSPNYLREATTLYTAQLEQQVFRTERQHFALQLAWQREDSDRWDRNFIGSSAINSGRSNYTLSIDPNTRLLDGRANPFFGRPFVNVYEATMQVYPSSRDSFRAQAAYLLDFTSSSDWRRWLGRHQLVGYGEYRHTERYRLRWRAAANITDHPIYSPVGVQKGDGSAYVGLRANDRYYVGDASGYNVDYAPTPYKTGTYTFNWFNPLANQWVADSGNLQPAAMTNGVGGGNAPINIIKTRGGTLQSSLLRDRVVLTFGMRSDENYTRNHAGAALAPSGYEYNWDAMYQVGSGDWVLRTGDTFTKGVVVKPWSWLNLHYSQSDSFKPINPTQDLRGEPLPNPSSVGKDYGFTLKLLGERLVVRANKYETRQKNSSSTILGNIARNLPAIDYGTAQNFTLQRQARAWTSQAHPTWTSAQVDAEVYRITGLSAEEDEQYSSLRVDEVGDVLSRGEEYEVNYNPTRNWTVKFNASRNETIDTRLAPGIMPRVNLRMPIWTTIVDPRTNTLWIDTPYSGSIARAYINSNILANYRIATATEGKKRPQIREWRFNASTSYRLAGLFENKHLKRLTVGGALRWESRGAIGYYGIPVNGDIYQATDYDPDRPIWDKSHYYIDAFAAYNVRLFGDRVRARFQINGRNLQEAGRLQPVAAYPDGRRFSFRIIDPRTFIFSASFDL